MEARKKEGALEEARLRREEGKQEAISFRLARYHFGVFKRFCQKRWIDKTKKGRRRNGVEGKEQEKKKNAKKKKV